MFDESTREDFKNILIIKSIISGSKTRGKKSKISLHENQSVGHEAFAPVKDELIRGILKSGTNHERNRLKCSKVCVKGSY